MRKITAFILIAVPAFFVAAPARAADLPPPLPPLPALIQRTAIVQEYTSGWYLRGDAGYRFNTVGSASASPGVTPVNNRIDDSIMAGAGAGYKAGWFRADATLEYGLPALYRGDTATVSNYSAKIDTFTVLANIYFDLGTWSGFTPYIGAGAGGSYLRAAHFATLSPVASGSAGFNRWDFSWAAMAGVSYSLTPKFLVDTGYRYIHFGDAMTSADTVGNQLTFKNLSAHEFRLGVRYMLD